MKINHKKRNEFNPVEVVILFESEKEINNFIALLSATSLEFETDGVLFFKEFEPLRKHLTKLI